MGMPLQVDNVRVGAYRRAHQTRPRHQKLLVFKLFLRQYVYCSVHDTFEALPSMPNQLPARIRKALNSLQAINLGETTLVCPVVCSISGTV